MRVECNWMCALAGSLCAARTYLAAAHNTWLQLNFNARIEYTRTSNTLPSNLITVIFAIRFIHFNWLTCSFFSCISSICFSSNFQYKKSIFRLCYSFSVLICCDHKACKISAVFINISFLLFSVSSLAVPLSQSHSQSDVSNSANPQINHLLCVTKSHLPASKTKELQEIIAHGYSCCWFFFWKKESVS